MDDFTNRDMEEVLRAIASLICKSEKAQKKLVQGTWHHTMLSNNLKALGGLNKKWHLLKYENVITLLPIENMFRLLKIRRAVDIRI